MKIIDTYWQSVLVTSDLDRKKSFSKIYSMGKRSFFPWKYRKIGKQIEELN